MSRFLLWQEIHPTVHGGAESWLKDTATGLTLRGHAVAWLQTKQIEQAVDEFKPDAVIMGTLHCFVGLQHVPWLAEQRIPAVWMLHDYWQFCGLRMLMRWDKQSDQPCEAVLGTCWNSCGQAVDLRGLVNKFYLVTGCEGAAAIMRRNGVNVRAVVEEGIDTDLFKSDGTERDAASVLYASAVGDEVWKGMHILRHAAATTELAVRFLHGLSRAVLAQELRKASVYVFPSVYQEIWGLALTEAMASGCAAIASDVAGARAQVHEGTGILIPPGDVTALRGALLELTGNPKRVTEMGQAARAHVAEDHSLEALGARWESLLNLVARRDAAA